MVVFYSDFVDLVTEIEKDAEGGLGKKGVGRMREDMIARKMLCLVGKARGHQELFYGEM